MARPIRLRALVGFYRATPAGLVLVHAGETFSAPSAEAVELLQFGRAEPADERLVLARPTWTVPTVRGA